MLISYVELTDKTGDGVLTAKNALGLDKHLARKSLSIFTNDAKIQKRCINIHRIILKRRTGICE